MMLSECLRVPALRNRPPALKAVTYILFILTTGYAFGLAAQGVAQDGTLLGERPYSFPDYAQAYGYTRFDGSQDTIEKYWTKAEYESAVDDQRFEFQKLLYASDGLSVVAYVYKPREITTALPTIVFNRGSGVHKDIAPVLVPYFHRLAQQGFVIVAPMYRQSDGGEGIDGNGGDDLADLLNIQALIESLPYADANNIFMTGESRGAMMVYQAIREGFPMRAAAVWGGFTDLQPLIDAQPMMFEYAKNNWPGFTEENLQAEIEKRSAVYWAEQINVPVLLMHGESDGSIPVGHTYELATRLQDNHRMYSLIVYADDNHILSRSQEERDRATVKWFRNFDSAADAKRKNYLTTLASEDEINDVGYSLLRRGRLDEAITVLVIGTQRFPKSANSHDSLGEAQAYAGDTQAAISSYSKALALSTDEADLERVRTILADLNGPQ